MGDTRKDQRTRITRILSGTGRAGGGSTPHVESAEDVIICPLEGIVESGSAQHLVGLSPGTALILDDDGARVDVYHGSVPLGYLGGDSNAVLQAMRQGSHVVARMHSQGGTADEPSASVAIWL